MARENDPVQFAEDVIISLWHRTQRKPNCFTARSARAKFPIR